MIAIKTKMKALPKYCDECTWYQCFPHPDKGWTQGCGLMMQCLDDDQPEKWRYDGNERPKACPLFDTDQMPANIRWTPVEEAVPAEYVREVERGRWLDLDAAPGGLFYATCSVCGERQVIEVANYCPMCGANLSKEENE